MCEKDIDYQMVYLIAYLPNLKIHPASEPNARPFRRSTPQNICLDPSGPVTNAYARNTSPDFTTRGRDKISYVTASGQVQSKDHDFYNGAVPALAISSSSLSTSSRSVDVEFVGCNDLARDGLARTGCSMAGCEKCSRRRSVACCRICATIHGRSKHPTTNGHTYLACDCFAKLEQWACQA